MYTPKQQRSGTAKSWIGLATPNLFAAFFTAWSILLATPVLAQDKGIFDEIDWVNVNSYAGELSISEDVVQTYNKYAVGLFSEQSWDKAFCSATLIDHDTIITAEHCVDDCMPEWPPPEQIYVGMYYELPPPPELPIDCYWDCPAGCSNQVGGVDYCYDFPSVRYFLVTEYELVGHDGSAYGEEGQKVDVAILNIESITSVYPDATSWSYPAPRIMDLDWNVDHLMMISHPFAIDLSGYAPPADDCYPVLPGWNDCYFWDADLIEGVEFDIPIAQPKRLSVGKFSRYASDDHLRLCHYEDDLTEWKDWDNASIRYTDLDTNAGSSGAGIIAVEGAEAFLVGVHTGGRTYEGQTIYNFGVSMQQIYDISDQDSIIREIIDVSDYDGDGVTFLEDNCPEAANAGQENCDYPEDDLGDVCDDDFCVDFCGDGVVDWSWTNAETSETQGTPQMIEVNYCTVGSSEKPGEPHTVQMRWCDCSGWGSEEECKDHNCDQDDPSANYQNHFEHQYWHMATYQPGSEIPPPYTAPAPPAGEPLYWPEGSMQLIGGGCYKDDDWSYWASDEGNDQWTPVQPWLTYHCGPEAKVDYLNPLYLSAYPTSKYNKWLWNRELWWQDTMVEAGIHPRKEARNNDDWGYLWLRPELDGNLNDGVGTGQGYDQANNYTTFRLYPKVENPVTLPPEFPGIYDVHPVEGFPPFPEDALIAESLPHVRSPRIALSAIPLSAAADTGIFAFTDGLVGADAAVAGLVVLFVDGWSLEVRAQGYSTGASFGAVPDTAGFSAASFGWRVPGPPGGTDDEDHGVAVFGGEDNAGRKADKLWLGRFGGLDADGVPYFEWQDTTPLAGPLPEGRTGAGMVFDAKERLLYLFGGELAGGAVASDLWAYDFELGEWDLVSDDLLDIAGFAATSIHGKAYVAGGHRDDGSWNTDVYRIGLQSQTVEVLASLTDGPGARRHISAEFDSGGGLLVYGGFDETGSGHNDLWRLDLGDGLWDQRLPDCTGLGCPTPWEHSFVLANPRAIGVGLYGVHDESGNRYYKATGGQGWQGSSVTNAPPPVLFVANGEFHEETEIENRLEFLGFEVDVLADFEVTGATDLTDYDMIVITEFAHQLSYDAMLNIERSDRPLLIIEYYDFWYSYMFELTSDYWSWYTTSATAEVVTQAHPITAQIGEDIQVYTDARSMNGIDVSFLKEGVTPLVYTSSCYDEVGIIADDERMIVANGLFRLAHYDDGGWNLFDRCVEHLTFLGDREERCVLDLHESFDAEGLPEGWVIEDGDGYLYEPDGYTWEWTDVGNDIGHGSTGGHYWVNSDQAGYVDMVESLVSDAYTRGSCPTVRVGFNHRYTYYSGDRGEVSVQVDGSPWQVVETFTCDMAEEREIDITPYLGDSTSSEFRLRFRYIANYDWHWKIDDVSVRGSIR